MEKKQFHFQPADMECGAGRLNNPVVTALGHPQSLSQSRELISKLLSLCFQHGHRLSHGSQEGFGAWKLPAPSGTKQQGTGKSKEGECSHFSSPFSPAGLSKLPGLITPAVSLGTTEGCCGSEMLFKNTLIGVVLPVSAGAIPRPGENNFILSFSLLFFFPLFDVASQQNPFYQSNLFALGDFNN